MGVKQKREDLLVTTILAPTLTKTQLRKTEHSSPCSKCAPSTSSSRTHLWFKIDFQLLSVLDQLPVSPAQEREGEHADYSLSRAVHLGFEGLKLVTPQFPKFKSIPKETMNIGPLMKYVSPLTETQ